MSSIFIYIIFNQVNKFAAILIFLILITTNLYSYIPFTNWKLKWLLPAYLIEITNKYPTATEEVTKYIKDNIPSKSSIFIGPDYKLYPILFYAPEYTYPGQLTEDSHILNSFSTEFKNYFLKNKIFPQYIILFGFYNFNFVKYFSRKNKLSHKYKLVKTINIFCGDPQKPEILFHAFSPVIFNKTSLYSVFIYKQIKQPSSFNHLFKTNK